jgi:hypothetical protein
MDYTVTLEAPQIVGATEISAELEWPFSARDMFVGNRERRAEAHKERTNQRNCCTPATQVGEAQFVSVGLERGRDDQGRATRPHGERVE